MRARGGRGEAVGVGMTAEPEGVGRLPPDALAEPEAGWGVEPVEVADGDALADPEGLAEALGEADALSLGSG